MDLDTTPPTSPSPAVPLPEGFRWLPEGAAASSGARADEPSVQRGGARDWPAVRGWDLARLAELDPQRPVQLVVGDREQGSTRFERSTLGDYLRSVAADDPASHGRHLKEFDLLGAFPRLRADLRTAELFPPGSLVSSSAWIGPTGARTGLHHDLLDNAAVQVLGHKRFLLCRPGTVERAGALSSRYDRWARLSSLGALEVARAVPSSDDYFVVDLAPGDVLRVPGGWWHQVVNLSPAVLLSGFGGRRSHVMGLWGRESARHLAHRLALTGRNGCTCHSAGDHDAGPAAVVRFLTAADVPQLMRLEQQKWTQEQATTAAEMELRIRTHPSLSMGASCPRTGTALASLFLRPISEARVLEAVNWQECARTAPLPDRTTALFGMSLSSNDGAAVDALMAWFWPQALKAGWRDIYLGSPVPGLASWRRRHPDGDVDDYVRARRHGLPVDPQLRYYYGKGFRDVVACKPDYFPHEASLDHGVVLRGRIPLSGANVLWRRLPLRWLRQLEPLLSVVLRATDDQRTGSSAAPRTGASTTGLAHGRQGGSKTSAASDTRREPAAVAAQRACA